MMSDSPAVIDFSLCGLDKPLEHLSDQQLRPLAGKLGDALLQTGLVYLVNHGIDPQDLKSINDSSKNFFNLPLDIKKKYHSAEDFGKLSFHGYMPPGWESAESLMKSGDPESLDILESMHIRPVYQKKWPNEEVPGFRTSAVNFMKQCETLCYRILKLVCIALDYADRDYILRLHRFGEDHDPSGIKLIHYYPVSEEIPADKMRIAEHIDHSSVSLIFQDDSGGLEYQAENGNWLPVQPVKNSVVLNVAHFLEIWTTDKLKAAKHRVAIPADPAQRKESRYSMVYFACPAPDSPLKCLDGSDKYEQTTCSEYYEKMIPTFAKYDPK